MSEYRCNACGKHVQRQSDMAWFRSLCAETHSDARLVIP